MNRAAVTLAAFVALAVLLWYARVTALLLFAAMLLALVLDSGTGATQRFTRLGRVPALIVLIVLIGAILGIAVWLGGDAIAQQLGALWISLPAAGERAAAELSQTVWGRWILANALNLPALPQTVGVAATRLGGIVSGTLSAVLSTGFVIFVAVCLAIEPALYIGGLVRLFPPSRRNRLQTVLFEISESLRWWLIARLISMLILAVLVTTGLSLLRIPLAGLLGIIAGCLAFVPNIGAIVAALPALILAFAIGPERALAVLVMYWVCHFLDDFFIVPVAERKVVQLPPALTITAQVLLAVAGGVIGIMLAAPLTACTIILVRRLWVEDVLENRRVA